MTLGNITDLAEKYGFLSSDENILLLAILTIGLHFGLRLDEVLKLQIQHVSVSSEIIELRLFVEIKNYLNGREYKVEY